MVKSVNTGLTVDYLRSILHYNRRTGIWTWLHRSDVAEWWNGKFAGTTAGSTSNGCLVITINYRHYYAQNLAWLYVKGVWPAHSVDHKDNDPLNCRWSNLRKADDSQQVWNQRIRANNTSGYKGVSRHRDGWQAQIMIRREPIFLGVHPTAELAADAYLKASCELHGEFANFG